eukprot:gene35809-44158_t
MTAIPDLWFVDAFTALPFGLAIFRHNATSDSDTTSPLIKTSLWATYFPHCEKEISRLLNSSTAERDKILTTASLLTTSTQTPFNVQDEVYQVVMLRPVMSSVSDPYYVEG